eukprot:TRINITY_DN66973_c6_g1_i7.p1 TRINITY_DN66973_c6_g1~~TRINITY_DN66973_c6_g1_i7.p1  ORF type:complete len:463 (+),score=238.75 TRINITY_DN66973_c6_g1_i7:36-1424(+)
MMSGASADLHGFVMVRPSPSSPAQPHAQHHAQPHAQSSRAQGSGSGGGGFRPPSLKKQASYRLQYPALSLSKIRIVGGAAAAGGGMDVVRHDVHKAEFQYSFDEENAFLLKLASMREEQRQQAERRKKAEAEAKQKERELSDAEMKAINESIKDAERRQQVEALLRKSKPKQDAEDAVAQAQQHVVHQQEQQQQQYQRGGVVGEGAGDAFGSDDEVEDIADGDSSGSGNGSLSVPSADDPRRATFQRFKSLANLNDDSKCNDFLQMHDYNLERAISKFFDVNGNVDAALAERRNNNNGASAAAASASVSAAQSAPGGGLSFVIRNNNNNNNNNNNGNNSNGNNHNGYAAVADKYNLNQQPPGYDAVSAASASSGSSASASASVWVEVAITMPDGIVQRNQFRSDDTLWTVYQFVAARAQQWGNKPFNLVRPSPKLVFTERMLNMTLREAGMVDNGALRAVVV